MAITTAAELDAMPEGSVIFGYEGDGRPMVALKPRASDYPANVYGMWEIVGTETAMSGQPLLIFCKEWEVLRQPDTPNI